MDEEDYKTAIKLLRLIASDVISLKDEFRLDAGVIAPILRKEEVLEEILTANFIDESKEG